MLLPQSYILLVAHTLLRLPPPPPPNRFLDPPLVIYVWGGGGAHRKHSFINKNETIKQTNKQTDIAPLIKLIKLTANWPARLNLRVMLLQH